MMAAEGSLAPAPQTDPETPYPIDSAALERALEDCTQVRGPAVHMACVDSTSTQALRAAQSGARTGVWTADEQTAGRGRGGHSWHSGPGEGLYCSVLVAPLLPASQALLLSLATGLAAQAAIRACTGLEVDLRWPNDLLLRGRKCGGILVETAVGTAQPGGQSVLRHAVIGIGINVHQEAFPPELAGLATSLQLEGAAAIQRQELLNVLLPTLDREVAGLQVSANEYLGTTKLLERFTAASTWVAGKRVSVPEDGGYTGVTAGLNESGFLLVRDQDETMRVVRTGGVRQVAEQYDASGR